MAKKSGNVKESVVKVGAQECLCALTFNNVIITITNEVGDVISWSSAGDGLPWFKEEHTICCTDSFCRLCKGCL